MRVSPLAAGCVAAVLGGTVVVLLCAWRDSKKLIADGVATERALRASGVETTASRNARGVRIQTAMQTYGTQWAHLQTVLTAQYVVQKEYGITPQFIADVTRAQQQTATELAAGRALWAAVRARLAASV